MHAITTLCHGEGMHSTEYCYSSWLFVEFFMLKWSIGPSVAFIKLIYI